MKEKVLELVGRLAAAKAIAPILPCEAMLAEAGSFFPDPSILPRHGAGAPLEKGRVATVFSRGGGLEGFEGGIEVDDEFAHEGGEGDFGRFAFGSEALVNFLED